MLAIVSSVGDFASTLPCWEWFSFVVNSLCVLVRSRGLLGGQSGCVRGQSLAVGGTVGDCLEQSGSVCFWGV